MVSQSRTLIFSLSPILAVICLASALASLPFDLKQNASLGFPDSSVGKESACNAGDPSSIPGSGISPGEGIGYPLQYFGASLVAQMVKNLPAMQETWVRSLAWEDPLEEAWKPTPVFWPGESQGQRSLVDYSPWGHKESDTLSD